MQRILDESEVSSSALINHTLNQNNESVRSKRISILHQMYSKTKNTHDVVHAYFLLVNEGDEKDNEWNDDLKNGEAEVDSLLLSLQEFVNPENSDDNCSNDLRSLYVMTKVLSARASHCVYLHHKTLSGNEEKLKNFIDSSVQALDYFNKELKDVEVDIELLEELYFAYELINGYSKLLKDDRGMRKKLRLYRSVIFDAAEYYLTVYRDVTNIVVGQMMLPRLMYKIQNDYYGSLSTVEAFKDQSSITVKENIYLDCVIVNTHLMSLNTIMRSASMRRNYAHNNFTVADILDGCTQLQFNQYLGFEREQLTALVGPSIDILELMLVDFNRLYKSPDSIMYYKAALKDIEQYLKYYFSFIETWLETHTVIFDKDLDVLSNELEYFKTLMKRMDVLINEFKKISIWANKSFESPSSFLVKTDANLVLIEKMKGDNVKKDKEVADFASKFIAAENERASQGKSKHKVNRNRNKNRNKNSTQLLNSSVDQKDQKPVQNNHSNIKSIKKRSSNSDDDLLSEAVNQKNVYADELKLLDDIEQKARLVHSTLMLALKRIYLLLQGLTTTGEAFSGKRRKEIREKIKAIPDMETNFDLLCVEYQKTASLCGFLDENEKAGVNHVNLDFMDMKNLSDKLSVDIAILRDSFISASDKIRDEKCREAGRQYVRNHPELNLDADTLSEADLQFYGKLQFKETAQKNLDLFSTPSNRAEDRKMLLLEFSLFQKRKEEFEKNQNICTSSHSLSNSK